MSQASKILSRVFKALILISVSSALYAGDYTEQVGPFGTLDNTHAAVTIPNSMSQDLLNVDITPNGKSVKKREGYGTAFTLSNATSPLKGEYLFYDSNGADVVLSFNDRNMNVSVSGASPTVFFSTGPNGATYQCVDAAAYAYCANTSRTSIVKVNSSTYTLVTSVVSTGTILAVTPERLVMAGFSEAPNRIDFSKANDFTTWTPGSTNADPINFTINAPGSKITHLVYAHQRIYWFKDSSFGYIIPGDTDANVVSGTGWSLKTLNSTIGTLYNTSIYRNDILYFQGNDGHFYAWDGANLTKMSTNIQSTIDVTQGRASGSWTQTTQGDFSAGSTSPQGFISSGIVSGQLMPSSFTATETSQADFNNGTVSNVQVNSTSLIISTSNHNYFDTSNAWSIENFTGYWNFNSGGSGAGIQASIQTTGGVSTDNCGSISAQNGTKFIQWDSFGSSVAIKPSSFNYQVLDSVNSSVLASGSITYTVPTCTWTQKTISAASIGQSRQSIYLKFYFDNWPQYYFNTNNFIFSGGNITFYYSFDEEIINPTNRHYYAFFDTMEGGYSPSTGTYTSQSYDTHLSTNYVSISTIGVTVNKYNPTLTLQTSVDNSNWTQLANGITNSTVPASYIGNRYVRYIASFTVTGSSDAFTTFDDATLVARSSGTYYSAVHNAPSLTSWDSFTVDSQNNGGSLSYFIRSSTGVFYSSATPNPSWTSISNGGIPTATPNVYFQVAASFTVTAATQNPTINSFTQNWFEGGATDKTFALYHDNALWWSVASGTGATTNNTIIKYDLLNNGYVLYDIPMNGMYERSQSLYFGSPSAGIIYKFGDVDSDAGSAINAYWKSKDFFGTNPFLDKSYKKLSVFAGSVANSTMTISYVVSGTSTTSYNLPLYNANRSFVNFNKNLPQRVGNTINVQFGNNAADQPFEVYGAQIESTELPWNVNP